MRDAWPALRGTICLIGEGMVELSRGAAGWNVGCGGDTVNIAVHLARFGRSVAYATALGTDPLSDQLRADWRREGVETGVVLAAPDRLPGFYVIETDATGERRFHYARGESAARRMFDLLETDRLIATVGKADVLIYSLITLAILPDAARATLFGLCRAIRARGGTVVFDGNYRPLLWRDAAAARTVRDEALGCCDIGLPTLADEIAMGDATGAAGVADHWRAHGVREVVVKLGAAGCLSATGTLVAPPHAVDVIDTSGAGDAFDAGYLDARLAGHDPDRAALAGHALAGWAIARRGAIPARDAAAPYASKANAAVS